MLVSLLASCKFFEISLLPVGLSLVSSISFVEISADGQLLSISLEVIFGSLPIM
jgi:hypothetical protein